MVYVMISHAHLNIGSHISAVACHCHVFCFSMSAANNILCHVKEYYLIIFYVVFISGSH